MRKPLFACLTVLASLAFLAHASPQTPTKETVIYIEELDCEACAETIHVCLEKVPGMAKVKTDIKKQTATVTPKADKTLSPKALWEAVEEAGFTPTRLIGPSGTFTKKPPK